jgi:protein gp37
VNEQKAPAGIEWTRCRNADGTTRRGFTWNPVAGCLHDCEWDINGQRAECYAKTIAEKFTAAYPDGFASYYWHPKRLSEPKKVSEGAGIFPDSMSDLFGRWVHDTHLYAVLDVMEETPQHIYQCLTKYAMGYNIHQVELPANLWAGVSSPPDHMWGNDLNDRQKARYLAVALNILDDVRSRGLVTWMSFEPLSRDWSEIVRQYPKALKWAVIGAASDGRKYIPPDEKHVRNLLEVLDDQGVAVFFKGNMASLPYAKANWRADFPTWRERRQPAAVPTQARLWGE